MIPREIAQRVALILAPKVAERREREAAEKKARRKGRAS